MNPTDTVVAKALDGLDDTLEPITTEEKPIEKEVVTPEEGDKHDDPAKEKDPKDDKKDEGYSADELEDEDEPVAPPEVPEVNTDGLSPEQKYIVDNLPYMTARVKVGDATKELQVKSWTQLPEDVTFATKRDELAFMNALTAQENRALQLQGKFQQDTMQKQNTDFEKRENEANRQDIAELQRAGNLPKFKANADSPDFAKDPATQEVQKVLDYMNQRNEQYLKEYNQGRPYRHIGFKEAYGLYEKQAPIDKAKDTQKAEDAERRTVADKVGRNQGLKQGEFRKALIHSGTRTDDLIARFEAGDY
jgi:hypothetical protein